MAVDLGKIGMTPEGVYNVATVYERLDVVSFNGSSYTSRIDNNNQPLTNVSAWQLNASKGETGIQGIPGENGVYGITDEANPLTVPTAWTSGDPDLFEVYLIDEVGTYTNFKDSGNNSIIVDPADLENKITQIWVRNGVAKKVVNDIPGVMKADEFDPTDNAKAITANQTAQYLGTIDTISNITLGIEIEAFSTTAVASPDEVFFTNSVHKVETNLILKEIVTNFQVGGEFKIGKTDANNNIIYISSTTYNVASGWQVTDMNNLELNEGETVWLVTTPTTSAVIFYAPSGAPEGTFLQRPSSTGNIITGTAGSFYNFYFHAEQITEGGILDKYLTKEEAEGIQIIEPLETFGSVVRNSVGGIQTSTGYFILRVPFTEDKIIQSIDYYSGVAGSVNFVIGTIEQAGRFVEIRNFNKDVIVGLNNIEVSEILLIGEFIGMKIPGIIPDVDTTIANDYLWATESGFNSPLFPGPSYSLAMALNVKTVEISGNSFAKKSQLLPIQERIEEVALNNNVLVAPNGSKYKLKVDNNGVLSTEQLGNYNYLIHFGNSILLHSIQPYWWGYWGMAASTRENDYAHKLKSMLQVSNPGLVSFEHNIAEWELNPSTYDKTNFDAYLSANPYDLVVVRLGENVTYYGGFKQAYKDLILYIQSKLPNARIVIGGLFWANTQKEMVIQEVATELGLTYVSMAGLDIPANKSFIGDVVQGDDNQSHVVDNAGVANHPNDTGMLAIAERLFTVINL